MQQILNDSKKRLIAIILVASYVIILPTCDFLSNPFFSDSLGFAVMSIRLSLPSLITPCLVLIFLLTIKKDYPIKNRLLPIGFGVEFFVTLLSFIVTAFFALIDSDSIFSLDNLLGSAIFVLGLCAKWAIWKGSRANFKCLKHLRIGSIALTLLLLIIFLGKDINMGEDHISNVSQTLWLLDLCEIIKNGATPLFWLGVFVFSTSKSIEPKPETETTEETEIV